MDLMPRSEPPPSPAVALHPAPADGQCSSVVAVKRESGEGQSPSGLLCGIPCCTDKAVGEAEAWPRREVCARNDNARASDAEPGGALPFAL